MTATATTLAAITSASIVRGSRANPHLWSISTGRVQPRVRPMKPPSSSAITHSASCCKVASKMLARSISATTAAKAAGIASRHRRMTPPRACGDMVQRQKKATNSVSTLARLSGEIIGRLR